MTSRSILLPLLLLISSTLISACSPFVTSTPPPSPQPIQVAYTSTLRPLVKRLHQCALDQPGIALITQETSILELEFTGADLTLWFGEPPQGATSQAFSLGEDQIVIVAGSNVVLPDLNAQQLQKLYTASDSSYQMWTYSQSNELRILFENAVLGETSISSDALLAPHPAAMLEAISANPMAIGYLPRSWLTGNVQSISIDSELQGELVHPILALPQTEPQGSLKTYFVCLQNTAP